MAKLCDVDAHFKIETDGKDLYLTVHPPVGDGAWVSLDDVLEELKELKDISVDLNLTSQVVNEATGIPVKIGTFQEIFKEEKILIEVTYDELRAYLTLPGDIPLEVIKQALENKGVIANVDEHAIIDAIERRVYHTPILIAQAIMPIPGKDAVIEFKFEKNKKVHLKEKEDGRVDFRELGLIDVVFAGDILAVKTPKTEGIPGMTVTGKRIPARDGIDKNLPAGRNTEITSDGLILKATIDGQVVWKNNRIHVEPVLDIKGDVDYSVGNIDFPGSVKIGGNILDGFTVKSGGNIEIQGCIEKAYVYAEGNILVGEGIIGKGEGHVRAKGTIWANFVEHGIVEAGEDVIVNESIRYSQVDAKKRVIVQGKIGTILGGRIRAGEEVNAKVIGSLTEARTDIEVGALPLIREEIYRLKQELAEDEEKFRGIEQGIKFLLNLKRRLGDDFPEEKERLLIQHIEAKNMLKEKIYTMSISLPALESEILQSKHGKVCVYKTAYPGTRITIRNSTFILHSEYKFVTFSSRTSGKIDTAEFEEPAGITMVKEPPSRERSGVTIPVTETVSDEKNDNKGMEHKEQPRKEEKTTALEVRNITQTPVVARLKTRLIADPLFGVLVSKIRVGDWVICKIVDNSALKHVRDLIRLKCGVVEGKVEEIFAMDPERSKVILSLGPGVQGETVVSNSCRIKTPMYEIFPIIKGIIISILTFISLTWILWWLLKE